NEDFPEEIFSNPLFEEVINSMRIGQHHLNAKSDFIGSLLNHDSSIIPSSSNIDSLLDEFAEINLTFTLDDPMPPSIKEDDDDSRDTLVREELLDNYSLLIPENESFHFDIPLSSCLPAKHQMEKSPDLLSHRGFENFQPSAECPMKIHGKNIPTLDAPRFHFYSP
nr:hypothetical protein [Tanacetum cinerariifolium]